ADTPNDDEADTPTAPTSAAQSAPDVGAADNVAIAKLLVELAKHLAGRETDPVEIAAYVFEHAYQFLNHPDDNGDDDDGGLFTNFDILLDWVSHELHRLDVKKFLNDWHAMHGDKWIEATAA